MPGVEVLLALGSNVAADDNVPKALRYLEGLAPALAVSNAYRTPPFGPVEGGAFLNLAVHARWHADLDALRHALKRLERKMGRPPGTTWKARPIDIDVIAAREPPRKGWTLVDDGLPGKPFLLPAVAELAPTLAFGNRTVADLAKAVPPDEAQVVELRVR